MELYPWRRDRYYRSMSAQTQRREEEFQLQRKEIEVFVKHAKVLEMYPKSPYIRI